MSQYIANLNTVSPQESSVDDFMNNDLTTDLGPFLTTEFFDFDMGDSKPSTLDNFDASTVDPLAQVANLDFEQPQSGQDFSADLDFLSFPDLSLPLDPTQPIQPLAAGQTQPFAQQPLPSLQIPQQPQITNTTAPSPVAGQKRSISDISTSTPQLTVPGDDNSRLAAEEDKRRRNTAASARFRVKKKQREQDLEKRAKEMTERATSLETKVQQLEMENRWLKSLITEKDVSKNGAENFAELYKQFVAKENADREKDGVGTMKPVEKKAKLEKA